MNTHETWFVQQGDSLHAGCDGCNWTATIPGRDSHKTMRLYCLAHEREAGAKNGDI